MRTRQLVVWLAAALTLLPAVVGTAEVAPSSVSYLQAQPQNPWITMALVAAGVVNPPTDHLRSVSGTTANDYAKTIMAVAAIGQNPATFGNTDYVAQLQGHFREGQIGDPAFLNDDAWGVLALAAASLPTSTPVIVDAATFLRTHQNPDGGFPFALGGSSDTNSTAVAVMALRESGLAADDGALIRAAAYLRAAQNPDGGFPYEPGGESDADSTAWVTWAIRKLGQDPHSWQVQSNDPLEFLLTLQHADGSFSWRPSVPGANLFATQDAVLALAGATMPVGYWQPPADTADGYQFRIEGRTHTLCAQRLAGVTAYDLLVAGQTPCSYTFSGSTFEGLGFLLTQVNDERADGFAAWLYLVNHVPAAVGLQGWNLQPSDEVLIYYDADYRVPDYPDYDRPLRLALTPAAAASGASVSATVNHFRDGAWVAAPGAEIRGGPAVLSTDASGTVSFSWPDGVYPLVAQRSNFIRSALQQLTVGSGVGATVGLRVEVPSPSPAPPGGGGSGGQVGGSAIVFTVTPSHLDFGQLNPGSSATTTVRLANGGTVALQVSGTVVGDPLFAALQLDNLLWRDFSLPLPITTQATTSVHLTVPSEYLGRGIKTGELIFWAEAE